MKISIPLGAFLCSAAIAMPAYAQDAFNIVYPPRSHNTRAEQIFFIGTAPPDGAVTINGNPIEYRSSAGHFAPSVPLEVGLNIFEVAYQGQTIKFEINRVSNDIPLPESFGFISERFEPKSSISRMPNEPICFKAIATPGSNVSVRLGGADRSTVPA